MAKYINSFGEEVSQKELILEVLYLAGPEGVRSDYFYKNFMPRASARIHELKEEGKREGYTITSKPAENDYVRYFLVETDKE